MLQAHESPVRSMQYAHNENWLLTGEDDGKLKYWKPNLECVKVAHYDAACIQGIMPLTDIMSISETVDQRLDLLSSNVLYSAKSNPACLPNDSLRCQACLSAWRSQTSSRQLGQCQPYLVPMDIRSPYSIILRTPYVPKCGISFLCYQC